MPHWYSGYEPRCGWDVVLLRFLALLFVSLAVVGCNELSEFADVEKQVAERMQDEDKKIAALRNVATKVNETEKFNTYFTQCPAASFGKEKSIITTAVKSLMGEDDLDQNLCSLAPELCMSMCLDGDDNGCLSLAQALEGVGTDKQIGVMPGRKAYALACATGSASGCTNRGGGLLNYPTEADPLSQGEDFKRHSCTFALFKLGCDQNDEWGCSMLGQAFGLGQGVAQDKALAKQSLQKACVLDAESEACNYAKQLQGSLFESAD